ncbi:MAG: fatty acid desaturase family protein [Thermoanaerobaculia bacterium]
MTPAQVRNLSTIRPARAVRDALTSWALIITAWTVAAIWLRWWVLIPAGAIVGTRFYALFIIGHDGLHRRVLRSVGANDLFCDLLVFGPIGAVTRLNRTNHILHHRYLASEGDPDRHRYGCFNRTTKGAYLGFLSGLASVMLVLRSVYFHRRLELGSERPSYTGRDLLIFVGWQALLIVGLTLLYGWWGYFVMWLVPLYAFTYCPNLVRTFLEHSHPESVEKADEHRLISYSSNAVEKAFFAPSNMNYHAAHHLWTSIPYYHLPEADRLIRKSPGSKGLIWRKSYIGYLLRYFLALPLPECRQDTAGT